VDGMCRCRGAYLFGSFWAPNWRTEAFAVHYEFTFSGFLAFDSRIDTRYSLRFISHVYYISHGYALQPFQHWTLIIIEYCAEHAEAQYFCTG